MEELNVVEVLRSVNESVLGFGEASVTTKYLVDNGYVELVFKDDVHWFGRLTKKGQKAISKK